MAVDLDFIDNNEELKSGINSETPIKRFLVDYVGNNNSNVNKESVTVENIIETFSEEFPEFVLALAEENWVRGYHQALIDVDLGEKLEKINNENI